MLKAKPRKRVVKMPNRPEFKEWFEYLRYNQRVVNAHPNTTVLGQKYWDTVAWNLAWLIVEQQDEAKVA